MQDYIKRFFSAGLIVLLGLGFPSEVWASPESGSGYMLVRNYGEPGMGAITAALGTAGCSNRTLILSPGIWTVGADLTIPNNISLKLERGAILVVARGKTLTLQGPVISGNYTIFAGNGSVSLAGGVKEVYPQWWGAKGYGTANDAAALQAAANAGARTMIIPPGTYRLATQLVDSYVINGHHYSNGYVIHIPSGLSILGAGEGKTILQVAVPYTSAFYNRGERDFAISGLTIEGFGRNENSAGMKFLTADNYSVARVEVKGMRMGFQALGCTNGHYWDCHAYDQRNTSDSDDARGFNVGDQTDHTGTKNITTRILDS
jgi:hypothetical protein